MRNFTDKIRGADWCDVWKNCLLQNYQQIPDKTLKLKEGLDEESLKTIDLIMERNFFLYPWNKHSSAFLYDTSIFFNEQEIEDQNNKKLDIEKINKTCKLLNNYYEYSVFYSHHGLKCLPADVLEQIKDRDVIDGGAYQGESAILLQNYSPKTVYSFEPLANNFECIKANILNNGIDPKKIIPINYGLSDKLAEEKILFCKEWGGIAVRDQEEMNYNERPKSSIITTTIDHFVEKASPDVGLIKLDIEGYELEAINGSINTITRFKPILIISVYHNPKDFFEIKPLLESLNLGYKFLIRKLDPNMFSTEVVLLAY